MSNEGSSKKQQLLADAALLLCTIIWGATFIMVDKAVDTIGTYAFNAFRFSIASVVLLLLFGYRFFKKGLTSSEIWKGIVTGFFFFGGYTFQTLGMQFGTSAGKAAFITGLSVVLVPIISAILDKQVPSIYAWLGILVAVVGLGLLSIESGFAFQLSDLLVLACAFCFAGHIIAIDKFIKEVHFSSLATFQSITTAVLAWISTFIFWPQSFPLVFNQQVIFALLFTGILATALILVLQTTAQKKTPSLHVAVIFSMEPVFGAFFAFIFGQELFHWRQWLGCGLILISMLWQQLLDIVIKPKLATKREPHNKIDMTRDDKELISEKANDNNNHDNKKIIEK
ncbi:MAG: DMT family transporter [Promethearchaeota archaeon]|nr:MAG: DMT family transporter [Candidatus Lokiarchaeota archaeon]